MTDHPIQDKKGYCEFYKLKFKVTPDVLIPRPETELLVDEVLKQLSLIHNSQFLILDIGTGAGNIAISLACNLPGSRINVNIIATDVSPKALKVARENAQFHHVDNNVTFIQSDLLKDLNDSQFSIVNCQLLIVTNLPYIPSARIPYLDESVKEFEPQLALDGGEDGFELYRELFQQIKDRGWKPSLIIGEIDYTHGELAQREASRYFPGAQVEIKTDLAHKQRVLLIR